MSQQFVGSLEIIERLGPVAYHLIFPSSLGWMHDVLYVSMLHHYMLYPSHIVDLSNLHISDEGALVAKPGVIT